MAHTALSGDAGGFVKFFGFTRMYTNAANELLTQPSPDASPAFLLVFEYATEGTILDYLRKHLHHGEVLQNWNKICSALNGITIGIKTIHGRNILHR
jgi:serine/threonine protein kinase